MSFICAASKRGVEIPLLESFRVFATVFCKNETSKVSLSPATRSRFTELWMPGCVECRIGLSFVQL